MKIKNPFHLGVFVLTILLALPPKLSNAARSAQSKSRQSDLMARRACFFIENKGQLSESPTETKYYGQAKGVFFYCKPGMISFVFSRVENHGKNPVSEATGLPDNDIDQPRMGAMNCIYTSRMDLVLTGSNRSANIIPKNQQKYYENFYTTGDADHGITNVHTYKTLTYKNIYPDIDLVLRAVGQGMEYSFLVHPGGKVSDIQLAWNGMENTKALANGGICFSNAIGDMNESEPKSFVNGQEVFSHYLRQGNHCGFKVENYNKKMDLLIDPTLTWTTYYGGEDHGDSSPINYQDLIGDISTDAAGNIFMVGTTYSGLHIATSGAYQTSYNGKLEAFGAKGVRINSSDVFVAKFNALDTLEWGTYYGGPGRYEETNFGNGIKTDAKGNVYIVGSTFSSSGIATSGAFQTALGGGTGYESPFLAKFNNTGGLDWATYFSGNGSGTGIAVTTDVSGNVIFTGSIGGVTGLATSGAYQTSYTGGSCCFLAKFSSSGTEIWATYYGQNGGTQENSLATDASGNIYMAGDDGGSSGLATSGAYQTSPAGSYDALLTKFSSSGARIWATYFGGSGEDKANAVVADANGNVYIAGQTESTAGLATSGAQQTFLGGQQDAFLAKFSNSGKLSWATYYGGTGDDEATGISMDIFGDIIMAGSTESSSGIATSNGFQTIYGGAFLSVYSAAGKLDWATYFGGDGETGNAVCTDASGNVYLTGNATDSGMATANVHQTINYGLGDTYLAKFAYDMFQNDAGIDSIESPSGTVCAGFQPLNVYLHNAGTKPLSSVKINWTLNGVSQPVDTIKNTISAGMSFPFFLGNIDFKPGLYTLKAWTSKPNGQVDSFPFNDTLIYSFTVNPLPLATTGSASTICAGGSVVIGSSLVNGNTYSWTSDPSGFTSTSSFPSVNPNLTTIYILTEVIAATGCQKTDSVKITVHSLPNADWTVSHVSQNYYFHAKDSSLPLSYYTWNFGDGSPTVSAYSPTHIFPKNINYTVKLNVVNSYHCANEYDSSINITVSDIDGTINPDLYDLSIYPNPFTDKVLLKFYLPQNSKVKISIMDMKGNVLFMQPDQNFGAGPNQIEINPSSAGLSPGTYFVNIVINDQLISKKIVLIKN